MERPPRQGGTSKAKHLQPNPTDVPAAWPVAPRQLSSGGAGAFAVRALASALTRPSGGVAAAAALSSSAMRHKRVILQFQGIAEAASRLTGAAFCASLDLPEEIKLAPAPLIFENGRGAAAVIGWCIGADGWRGRFVACPWEAAPAPCPYLPPDVMLDPAQGSNPTRRVCR